MLTKTRTTIITLIAAGSFATAAVVPAISQADPINGASAGCPYNGETYKTGQRISVISGAHYDS